MLRKSLSVACGVVGLTCLVLGMENAAMASAVPEIDAGSAVTAFSVLGAGFLMLRDRLSK